MIQNKRKVKLVSGETIYNGHIKFTGEGDYRKQIDSMPSSEIEYLIRRIERGDIIRHAEQVYAYAKLRLPEIIKKEEEQARIEEQERLAKEEAERKAKLKVEKMEALRHDQENMVYFPECEKQERLAGLSNEEIRQILLERLKQEIIASHEKELSEARLAKTLAPKERALNRIDFKKGMVEDSDGNPSEFPFVYITDKNVILLYRLVPGYYVYFPAGGRKLYAVPNDSKKKGWYNISLTRCDSLASIVVNEYKIFESFQFDFFRAMLAEFYADFEVREAIGEEKNNIPFYYPENGELVFYE